MGKKNSVENTIWITTYTQIENAHTLLIIDLETKQLLGRSVRYKKPKEKKEDIFQGELAIKDLESF